MTRRATLVLLAAAIAACHRDRPVAVAPAPPPASLAGQPQRPLDVVALDAFLEDARVRLAVPGAAVAVVQGGAIVYQRGFGVRVLGGDAPVTPDTLFMIASLTKGLTTMMEAALVDDGTVRWDSPLTTLLPSFAVGDAALTRQLVLWHSACACSGMPQQDLEGIFEWRGVTPEARIAAMATMAPTAALGATYQYSNLMVAAGGYAAAHAFAPERSIGDAYDAAMQAKIFDPIGMTSTTFDFAAAARADHAEPHAAALDGTTRPIPLAMEESVIPIRPAGGVWTSLRDLTRFVMTELAVGVAPDGTRVVSESNVLERRRPRIAREDDGDSYGLGLSVGDYEGLAVVEHSGGSFGFRTRMILHPDQRLAIVVLTNSTAVGGDLTEATRRKVIELVFAAAAPRAQTELDARIAERAQAIADVMARVDRAPDAAWLRGLAGTYRHPALGAVELRATPDGGVLDVGEWHSRVGRLTAADGAVSLVLLDPPFAGGALAIGDDTLTADGGYVLTR